MSEHNIDPFDLNRFLQAQQPIYAQALNELRAGRKRSHWSWFVLPQLRGLGTSAMSVRYALSGIAEATAYLAHPVLGPRLAACVQAMCDLEGSDAVEVLGAIDALKFHSCLTLFVQVAGRASVFGVALEKYFCGVDDAITLKMLGDAPRGAVRTAGARLP